MYGLRNTAIPLIVLFFLLSLRTNAQTGPIYHFEERKNAAIAELKKFPNPDTFRINALAKVYTEATFLKEREEVMPYRTEALILSRRLNYTKGLAQCYLSIGNQYKSASDYPTALIYFDSVLTITGDSKEGRLPQLRALALERQAAIFFAQDNYYMALDYFFESIKIPEYHTRPAIIRIYTFITDIYTSLNNLEKATEYAKKSIALIEKDSSQIMNSSVYFAVIDVCLAKKDFKQAEFYLDKISPMIPDSLEVQVNYGYYLKKGILYYEQQKYRNALAWFEETYKSALKGGHKNSISTALRYLSATSLKLEKYEEAGNYAVQNLALAGEMNAKAGKMDALINLSSYYHKTGNTKKAYEAMQQAMLIKDSLLSETNIKQVNILGAIYEADKQQKEIIVLQNEKEKQAQAVKQKSILNIVFICFIIILLFVGYLAHINYRKGREIARHEQAFNQQKIIELEKNKQLLTVDAMLKGQEEERSRIAKDLHDGLGSLLSGTKLSFINVKEAVFLSPENNALFDRSLSMLDNTIGDLRKVAQNLMPEALVKFGLHEAVRDFCDSIQSSSDIKVLYQQFGEKRKLSNTAEIFIYRIVQELVANVIKHAEASQVIVQLTMSNDRTGVTVEDNGKGFDKSILAHKKGAGMTNVNYRVQYFSGTIDIVSSPGSGTSVNIELPV